MPRSDYRDGAFETNAHLTETTFVSEAPATVGLPPRVRDASVTYPYEVEGESWLGTLGFLIGLVLFGLVVGYLLRGGNAQGSELAVAMPSPLVAASTLADADAAARGSKVSVLSEFGSDAPDELLSLDVLNDGHSLAGLVRLHNTRANAPDRISFVQVSPSGQVSEAQLSEGFDLRGAAISELSDGRFSAATVSSTELTLQALNKRGKVDWVRNFPISRNHTAPVEIVSLPQGAIAIGPGERAERVGLIHVGLDGDLVWQRSFAADPVTPDVHVASSKNGAVFIAFRELTNENGTSHTLMRIEADGQVSWKVPLQVGRLNTVTDFAYANDDTLLIAIDGLRPRLQKVSQDGAPLWQTDLASNTGQGALHLILDENGGAITAQPYSIIGERLYIALQKWDGQGRLTADGELTLPSQSSLDAMSVTRSGALVLAGSLQPDRFDDADVFVHQAILTSSDWLPRTVQPLAPAASEPSQEAVIAAAATLLAPETSELEETEAPLIAAVEAPQTNTAEEEPAASVELAAMVETSESTSTSGVVDAAPSTDASDRATTMAVEDNTLVNAAAMSRLFTPGEMRSRATSTVSEASPEFSTANEVDQELLTSPAISSFVPAEFWALAPDRTARAQCRFTCIDEGGTETFPMWTSVEATGAAFLTGLSDVHAEVCSAARGTSLRSVQPDCKQIN